MVRSTVDLLKGIGLAAAMLASAGLGTYQAMKLHSRAAALEELTELFAEVGALIRCRAADTEELLRALSDGGRFGRLGFLHEARRRLDGGVPARDALLEAAERTRGPLAERDAALILDFFRTLGTRDVEGELEHAARFRASAERACGQARAAAQEKGRLFCTLGVLGGLFLAVMAL